MGHLASGQRVESAGTWDTVTKRQDVLAKTSDVVPETLPRL